MAKLPWMQFYPADYLLDTYELTPAAKGIWMDLICHLWRADTRGTLTHPESTWRRILHLTESEWSHIVTELMSHHICDMVTDGHGNVTVQCRRILKEEKSKNGARLRKQKQRVTNACHDDVTPQKEVQKEVQKEREEEGGSVEGGTLLSVEHVVEVWNQTRGVKRAQSVTGPIRRQVLSRIREHPDVGWFSALFARVSRSDFLTGRKNDFIATLDWVLGPKNLAKIQAGNYDNREECALREGDRCQERVQRGLQLKPCGAPASTQIGKRPVCQFHQEEHHAKRNHASPPIGSPDGAGGARSGVVGAAV